MVTQTDDRTAAARAFLGLADHIYVINLPHRKDRRTEIDQQLGRLGKSLHDADVTLFPAVRPEEEGPFPSIGARGCFLSHLGVLRAALEAGHDRILILEDDADFTDALFAQGDKMASAACAQDWGLIYGGYRIEDGDAPQDGIAAWPPERRIVTSHTIFASRPAIERLIPYFELLLSRPARHPEGGPMHVDGAYSWFRKTHPDVLTLITAPPVTDQRPSRTDIHTNAWYESVPLFGLVRRVYRGLKPRG